MLLPANASAGTEQSGPSIAARRASTYPDPSAQNDRGIVATELALNSDPP